MATFTARAESQATVTATRAQVWAVLTDPRLLTELTPYLHRIDANGDRWRWHLEKLPVVGISVTPSFTEVMTFEEPRFIGFQHAPEHPDETTGVEGEYHLAETADGHTHLAIDLSITVELPVTSLVRPVVERTMRGVVAHMGKRFSTNLTRHLGATTVDKR